MMGESVSMYAPAIDCTEYTLLTKQSFEAFNSTLDALSNYYDFPPVQSTKEIYSSIFQNIVARNFEDARYTLGVMTDQIKTMSSFDAGDVVSRTLAKNLLVFHNMFKQNLLDNLTKACRDKQLKPINLHPMCSDCKHPVKVKSYTPKKYSLEISTHQKRISLNLKRIHDPHTKPDLKTKLLQSNILAREEIKRLEGLQQAAQSKSSQRCLEYLTEYMPLRPLLDDPPEDVVMCGNDTVSITPGNFTLSSGTTLRKHPSSDALNALSKDYSSSESLANSEECRNDDFYDSDNNLRN